MCKICLKRTLDATFLDCLALAFCDVIGELLPEWVCLTLQGGTTFPLTSKLADIPVPRVRKKYSFIVYHLVYANANLGTPRGLHDFDTPGIEWPYIQRHPIKEHCQNSYF